ncbi:MAG: hypothetical protein Kow0068_22130 [Marinilabiliales bacterium]
MLNFKISFLLVIITSSIIYAQNFEQNIKQSLNEKPLPFIKLDSRNSFISNRGARINSIKTGLEFNNTLCFGMGYEWLSSDIYVLDKKEINAGINKKIIMNYVSLFTEYNFYNKARWQFYLPLLFGIGESHYNYTIDNKLYHENSSLIVLYETEMIAQYKILKYFGIGIGAGYRILLKSNPGMEEHFTSPIYVLKLKIYFSDIYKDLLKSRNL